MTNSRSSSKSSPTGAPASALSFGRLLLPVLACGLILAGAIAMFRRPAAPVTESQVLSQIMATALHRSTYPGMDDGGPVGRWWIAAASGDAETGTLTQFRLSGGSIELTAREARVIVDAAANGVSFELHDVVFAVMPDTIEAQLGGVLTPVEYYVHGPITWRKDIVPDGGSPGSPRLTMHE